MVSHRVEPQLLQQPNRPQWVEDALRKQRQSTVQPPPAAAGASRGARASVAEDRERPLEVVAEQLDVPEPREKTHARRSGESRAREPSERAERLAPEATPPAERKTPKRKEKERKREPLDSAPRCVALIEVDVSEAHLLINDLSMSARRAGSRRAARTRC